MKVPVPLFGRGWARYGVCCAGAALAVLLVAARSPAYSADATSNADADIGALLGRLAASNCTFSRNGRWYTAAEARQHLARKWRHTPLPNASAEEFIELAASRSSETGTAYMVRCPGVPDTPAAAWLRQELAALRGASRP